MDDLVAIHPRAPEIVPLFKAGLPLDAIRRQVGISKYTLERTLKELRASGTIEPRWKRKRVTFAPITEPQPSAAARVKCLRCLGQFQSPDRCRVRICGRCRQSAE